MKTHPMMIRTGLTVFLLYLCLLMVGISSAAATTCQSGGKVFTESDIVWSKHHKAHLYCAGNDEWRYLAQWGLTDTHHIVFPEGNVGIGVADPQTTFHVQGNSYFDGFIGIGIVNPTATLHSVAQSDQAIGIFSEASSADAKAVYGWAKANSGNTTGGYFRADSPTGFGVQGWGGNRGVSGMATASSGPTYGVYGQSISPSGSGVMGQATASTGSNYGGYFTNLSTEGRGVVGRAYATTGNAWGGQFSTNSSAGRGVQGEALSSTGSGIGGYFYSNSQNGTGISAATLHATGVSTAGYFYTASPNGWAIRAVGNVSLNGQVNVFNNRILDVGAPVANNDAVNKVYADMLGGRTHCNDGQLLKWDGTSWECANDNMGFGNNGGPSSYFDGRSGAFTSTGGCIGTTATNYTMGSNGGNNFNASTGIYTIPEDGYYQFNATAKYNTSGSGNGVKILYDGGEICFSFGPTSGGNFYTNCSGSSYLTAGTAVWAQAHSCGSAQTVNNMIFSGFRVNGGSNGSGSGGSENLEWHTLTLGSGVGVYGATYYPPQIAKDALGFVHYRGLMNGTPSQTVAFDIPAGYEPHGGKSVELVAACRGNIPCEIIFHHPTHPNKAYVETGDDGTWVSLDGLSYYAGGGSGIGGGTSMVEGWPDAITCPRVDTANGVADNVFYIVNSGTHNRVWYAIPANTGSNWVLEFDKTTKKFFQASTGVSSYLSAASGHCLNTNTSMDDLRASGRTFNFVGGSGGSSTGGGGMPVADMSNTMLSAGSFPQAAGSVAVPAGGHYDLGNMDVTPGIYQWWVYNCPGQHSYSTSAEGNQVAIVGSPVHYSSLTYMNLRTAPSSTCGPVYTGLAKMTSSGTVSARISSYNNSTLLTPGPAGSAFRVTMVKITHAEGSSGGGGMIGYTATGNIALNGHWLSGDGDNEGVYVDGSGRVGIGTNDPQHPMHVKGSMVVERNYGGPSIILKNDKTFYTATDHHWEIYPGGMGTGNETDPRSRFSITTRDEATSTPTSRLTIISDTGNVGIGTANPQTKLDVRDGNIGISSSVFPDARLHLRNGTSIEDSWMPTMIGVPVGNRPLGVYSSILDQDDVNTTYPAMTFLARIGGDVTIQNRRLFDWRNNGQIFMSMSANGNLGIGTTLPYNPLHVAGNIGATGYVGAGCETACSSDGSHAILYPDGRIIITGTATKPGGGAWSTTSDIRLKDVDGPYEAGLDEILALEPIRYHYKVGNARNEPTDRAFIGLSAQAAQEVMPEMVSERGDGYLDLDPSALPYALINAIKELKAENDTLRERIDALEASKKE